MNFLTVGTWNANGLWHKTGEFRQFITDHNFDIFLVTETHLYQGTPPKVANYVCHFDNRPRSTRRIQQGGTAIYIKRGITHIRIPTPQVTSCEATMIQISLPGIPKVTVAAIYASPQHSQRLFIKDLKSITRNCTNFILAGDFNAHHQSWGCHNFSLRGVRLREWVDHISALVIAPPTPTCFVGRNPSTIDFCITCNIPFLYSCRTINDLSSDHMPVFFQFHTGTLDVQNSRPLKTNWDNYRYFLAQDGVPDWDINSKPAIESALSKLNQNIENAFTKATTTSNQSPNYYRLPPHIRALIGERNCTRRDWQSSRDPGLKTKLNRLQTHIRHEIRTDSRTRWNNYVEKLSTEDLSIWRATRILKKKPAYIPVLKRDETEANSNDEKAELLASSLQTQFEPNHDVIDIPTFAQVIPSIQNFPMSASTKDVPDTCPTELLEYIDKLKKTKAPGCDNIKANMIKFLPINYLIFISLLFNKLLHLNSFPNCWKRALVVPIHKPNSDPTNPVNYRPISLLSSLSKVYEYVLAKRLETFLSENDVIRPEQMGFRRQHSTQHQLWRVVELLQASNGKGLISGAIFVDISKAFDKIWHDGLIFKLIKINLPPQLIRIFSDYLTNRTFSVRVGNTISNSFPIKSGVPQGSLLGPKLFNLYVNDMPSDPNIHLALYADDTAFITSHNSFKLVFKSLQNYLHSYQLWLQQWRIKVNPGKCAAVLFCRRTIPTNTNFLLNNEIIPWTDSYKYLGVILDSKLIWRLQIEDTVRKSKAAKASLSYLLFRSSRLTIKNKLLLYKSFIRPVMTYGSIVWGCAAVTHLEKLQRIQNKTLSQIVSACRYVRMDTIHKDLKIRPFLPEIKRLAWKFHRGIIKINNPVLHAIPPYDPSNIASRKRPRALLLRSDLILPPSKRKCCPRQSVNP